MIQKFLFCLLLGSTLSGFTALPVTETPVATCGGGNQLQANVSGNGNLDLTWSFEQPALCYYVITDDYLGYTTRTLQTSGTSATLAGLPAGSYRVSVSNGSEFVIQDNVVVF